jgi:hypothetical protein
MLLPTITNLMMLFHRIPVTLHSRVMKQSGIRRENLNQAYNAKTSYVARIFLKNFIFLFYNVRKFWKKYIDVENVGIYQSWFFVDLNTLYFSLVKMIKSHKMTIDYSDHSLLFTNDKIKICYFCWDQNTMYFNLKIYTDIFQHSLYHCIFSNIFDMSKIIIDSKTVYM